MSKKSLSFIIPVHNKLEYTEPFLRSLFAHLPPDSEIVIVDNGSTDGTAQFLHSFRNRTDSVKVLQLEENRGYSEANNIGAKAAAGELLIFLNNDMLALPGSFAPYLEELRKEDVGMVGCRLLYANDTIQHAGISVHISGHPVHRKVGMPLEEDAEAARVRTFAITGACIGMRASDFRYFGGFDTGFAILYQDTDLCMKVLASGKQIIYRPDALLYHYESVTSGAVKAHDVIEKDWRLLRSKWAGIFSRLRDEANAFLRRVVADRHLLVYGTGRLAQLSAELIDNCGIPIFAFVDSDPERSGCSFLNRPVIAPLAIEEVDRPLILIASMREYEIRKIIYTRAPNAEIVESFLPTNRVLEIFGCK